MTIVTRFAPSPTGLLHIGGVRTALFSWLYARRRGGRFILRVEDTDRERSTEEAVQVILDGMQWLGLAHDEGPYFQSQRFGRYAEVLRQMLDQGNAYHCYCSKQELEDMRNVQLARKEKPRYDGRCRDRKEPVPGVSPVIRFKNIEEAIRISNGTAYGLSSSICTNRLDYITRFIRELNVGSVNVREVPGYRLELTPFGGIKDSGLGYKEGVLEAMKSFTNCKTYSLPW